MERLTVNDSNKVCHAPWELCGMDAYCSKNRHEEGGCTKGCHILEMCKKLAEYENLEKQGKILIVPQIPKNKTLYWMWGNEIMPVIYRGITGCVVDNNGKPHIVCEMVTTKDRIFVETYRRKPVEHIIKKGEKRYFYADDIGKTIFFTRKEAKEAPKTKTEIKKVPDEL